MVSLWNMSWRVFLRSAVLRVGEQVLWQDRPVQEHGPLTSQHEHSVLTGSAPMRHKPGFWLGSLRVWRGATPVSPFYGCCAMVVGKC